MTLQSLNRLFTTAVIGLAAVAIGVVALAVTLPREQLLVLVPIDPPSLTVEAAQSTPDALQPALTAEVVQPSSGGLQ
jgi:hypothetical protein